MLWNCFAFSNDLFAISLYLLSKSIYLTRKFHQIERSHYLQEINKNKSLISISRYILSSLKYTEIYKSQLHILSLKFSIFFVSHLMTDSELTPLCDLYLPALKRYLNSAHAKTTMHKSGFYVSETLNEVQSISLNEGSFL